MRVVQSSRAMPCPCGRRSRDTHFGGDRSKVCSICSNNYYLHPECAQRYWNGPLAKYKNVRGGINVDDWFSEKTPFLCPSCNINIKKLSMFL